MFVSRVQRDVVGQILVRLAAPMPKFHFWQLVLLFLFVSGNLHVFYVLLYICFYYFSIIFGILVFFFIIFSSFFFFFSGGKIAWDFLRCGQANFRWRVNQSQPFVVPRIDQWEPFVVPRSVLVLFSTSRLLNVALLSNLYFAQLNFSILVRNRR